MRRLRRGRRSSGSDESFGVSLMDLLTAALGCVLLIFIVYSVVTSGDLQRFLAKNTSLIEMIKNQDQVIAASEREATLLNGMIAELKKQLSAEELKRLEEGAKRDRDLEELKLGHVTSIEQMIRELTLLRSALDPQTARPVDVMLVIDGTNSMAPSLNAVRQNLRAIIGALQVLSPTARVGVTVYRDRRESKRIRLEYQGLSRDVDTLKRFLDKIKAKSTRRDRDRPEWMCGGLRAAVLGERYAAQTKRATQRINDGAPLTQPRAAQSRAAQSRAVKGWRHEAIKIVVVVSDAGSNSERARECVEVATYFKAQGGQVHVVSTLPKGYKRRRDVTREYDEIVLRDHAAIAKAGGGEHIQRATESTLLEEVLRSAFRSRLAELERLKDIIKRGDAMVQPD